MTLKLKIGKNIQNSGQRKNGNYSLVLASVLAALLVGFAGLDKVVGLENHVGLGKVAGLESLVGLDKAAGPDKAAGHVS